MSVTIDMLGATFTTDLSALEVITVKDLGWKNQIIVHVKPIPMLFKAWNGAQEYEEAGLWTYDTVLDRVTYLLTFSANNISWVV
jgi:hypothetical protein